MSARIPSVIGASIAVLLMGIQHAVSPAAAQSQPVPFAQGPVVTVDVKFPPDNADALFDGNIVWAFTRTMPFHNSAVPQTVRIRIDDILLNGPGDYAVDIADGLGNIVETFDFEDLQARPSIWSKMAPGGTISVRVRGRDAAANLTFRLSGIAFDFNAVAEKSLVGGVNGLTDVALYDGALSQQINRVSPSIAKLEYIKDGSKFTCSGFLVEPGKMVTNAHCIDSQPVCDTAIALFGYQKLSHGGISLGQQYRCGTFLNADKVLDAALIVLSERPDNDDPTRLPLVFSGQAVSMDEPLMLIQHPGGSPKKVSVEGCMASTLPSAPDSDDAATDNNFEHGCDTEQGSSGSPLLSADGRLVGLHKIGHGGDADSGLHNTALDARALEAWLKEADAQPADENQDGSTMSMSASEPPPPVSVEAQPGSKKPTGGEAECDEVNPDNCPEQFRIPDDVRDAQPLPMPTVDDEDLTETEGGATAGDDESQSEPGSAGSGTTE
jgi:hypothetical protein